MKLRALIAALLVAGLAASIALASPSSDGGGTTTGTTGATGGEQHGHHGGKPRCREVELKGTLAGGSLSLSVDRANRAGKTLGGSVTVAYGGTAKLHARLCEGTGGSAALELRDLKVEHAAAESTTTTTTTTTGH